MGSHCKSGSYYDFQLIAVVTASRSLALSSTSGKQWIFEFLVKALVSLTCLQQAPGRCWVHVKRSAQGVFPRILGEHVPVELSPILVGQHISLSKKNSLRELSESSLELV